MLFFKGRQILEADLIASMVINTKLKKMEHGLLCKQDIEKAYDHLRWDFLLKVLQKIHFGIGCIKWCISI